jgi:hypothetical protein
MNRMTTGLKVYWFLYNNVLLFACVISGIYWSMLYDGRIINLNNILVHMTNSLVLVFDLFIVNHPYRISHFIYPMICGSAYEIFTIVYTFAGGVDKYGKNYVYPILNWKEKPLSSVIVGTSAVFCVAILHMIVCGIHAARSQFGEFVSKRAKSKRNLKFSSIENGCNK